MPRAEVSRGGPGAAARSGPSGKRPSGSDIRKGLSGKTISRSNRHRKIIKDSIQGVTKPAIRRLARRGGVKRISADIYNEARVVLKDRLTEILRLCAVFVEYRNAKTVTVYDVIHSLRRLGTPVYGFDPETYMPTKTKASRHRIEAPDSP